MITTDHNIKKDQFIAEVLELRNKYHGFLMELSRASDVNYNNLSSIIHGKRNMSYKSFFALLSVFPKVKKKFEKKSERKLKKDLLLSESLVHLESTDKV
jgi:hypothetical protein